MVQPDEAIKGRAEAIVIEKPHYILNNPMMPPFPAEMERVIFGTGCFWGASPSCLPLFPFD
jgi:peptide-methionine (S)-S-oxide reductase